MPPCAAADEVRGQNLATAELNARHFIDNPFSTKGTRAIRGGRIAHDWVVANFYNADAPRKQSRRSGTLISLREVSQLHASSLQDGDITPEFSGRTMRPRSVHFIHLGPAATRC